MDVKDYRKAYEAELAAPAAAAESSGASNTFGAAVAPDDANRLTEIQRAPLGRDDFGEKIPALIATLRNAAESTVIRLAALRALRSAMFLGEHFAPFRADFLETLRQLAQQGTDPLLCEGALAVLAAEKDPAAQQQLRRGLQEPQSALVSPATALQLLGFDDHANLAELALDIFNKTADLVVKEAALRILATDAKSQELFTKLLQDKTQPQSLRALSAAGLNFLDPQKFAAVARNIVMDNNDFEDIRATALGALANGPLHHIIHDDGGFLDQIKKLGAQTPLDNLRAAAGRFLTKP
jgi:hypothetical protein